MNRDEIVKALVGKQSKRDKQERVGPSEVGGCRAKVWHRLNGTPAMNETLRLPSRMGTAIHKMLEDEVDAIDPFEVRYLLEIEVEADGLMGHVDLYDKEQKQVVDWKTTVKKNLSKFPSQQQRMQVQLYGYLLSKNGYEVETVSLVAIPRDGNENDIVVHVEPYDEATAQHGLRWLGQINALEYPPDPEMPARTFCQHYCQFYDPTGERGCTGK